MGIKHLKVSTVPDGTDPTQIQGSDWNEDHTIDDPAAVRADLELGSSATQPSSAFDAAGSATAAQAAAESYADGVGDDTLAAAISYTDSAIAADVDDVDVHFTDVTTGNASSTKHGFQKKSPADATKFLNGAATPDYAAVKDSDLSTSDITTNDVGVTKHGFTPKAPNDALQFLNGVGAWAVPGGSAAALPTFPSISGMVLRLSAEGPLTSTTDSRITQVNDISGGWSSHFTATGNARPRLIRRGIAGLRPGIQFDGFGTRLAATVNKTLNQPFTVVVAFQNWKRPSGNNDMYRDTSGSGPVFFRNALNSWGIFSNSSSITSTALYDQNVQGFPNDHPTAAAAAVSIQVYNGATSILSNNGVEVTGNAGAGGFTLLLNIGTNTSGTFSTFLLYEFLIFNSALGPSDRALLNAYYAAALQIDL